jgi:hypothetical protein
VRLPENAIEEADVRKVLYQDGITVWLYAPLYVPLSGHMEEVIKHSIDQTELLDRDKNNNLEAWLDKYGGDLNDYAFLPIHSRYKDAFIAISKATLDFIGIVEIPPPL